MKTLITLNFVIGFLLAVSFIASDKTELAMLPGMVLLPGFLLLALVKFIFVFKRWRQRRFVALVPFGTYVAAFALSIFVARCGTEIILKGTPCRPNSFFNEQTRMTLTLIANELIEENRDKNFAPEIYVKLSKFNLKPISVDTNQQIVLLGYYHSRHWFEYVYSKNGSTNLPPANTGYGQPVAKALGDNWFFRDW